MTRPYSARLARYATHYEECVDALARQYDAEIGIAIIGSLDRRAAWKSLRQLPRPSRVGIERVARGQVDSLVEGWVLGVFAADKDRSMTVEEVGAAMCRNLADVEFTARDFDFEVLDATEERMLLQTGTNLLRRAARRLETFDRKGAAWRRRLGEVRNELWLHWRLRDAGRKGGLERARRATEARQTAAEAERVEGRRGVAVEPTVTDRERAWNERPTAGEEGQG